ncbi:uncharacterized protein LOC133816653 [Humulus lupulus]|uniref:uncharacterized protein LOC133816653 n=1 Tax=Humulus lupulus TaxID=3486 RepID=UPI002B40074B|nr:uncharacterized protein LOC133816653 [Humulus lupulus]
MAMILPDLIQPNQGAFIQGFKVVSRERKGCVKGTLSAVRVFKVALEDFSAATWLSVNTSKSHIFFGGVNAPDRRIIAHEIQLSKGTFPLKYLGDPMRPTKWKHEDYEIIIQKIRLRLHTWASRHLSFAGRMQLIHSVLFGLRNYWMNIFLLPQSVVKEVEKLSLQEKIVFITLKNC